MLSPHDFYSLPISACSFPHPIQMSECNKHVGCGFALRALLNFQVVALAVVLHGSWQEWTLLGSMMVMQNPSFLLFNSSWNLGKSKGARHLRVLVPIQTYHRAGNSSSGNEPPLYPGTVVQSTGSAAGINIDASNLGHYYRGQISTNDFQSAHLGSTTSSY